VLPGVDGDALDDAVNDAAGAGFVGLEAVLEGGEEPEELSGDGGDGREGVVGEVERAAGIEGVFTIA